MLWVIPLQMPPKPGEVLAKGEGNLEWLIGEMMSINGKPETNFRRGGCGRSY